VDTVIDTIVAWHITSSHTAVCSVYYAFLIIYLCQVFILYQ